MVSWKGMVLKNFWSDIERFESIAIIVGNKQISYKELIKHSDDLVSNIPKHSLVFNVVGHNSFESIAYYIGLLRKDCVQILLPKSTPELVIAYSPNYIISNSVLYDGEPHLHILHPDIALLLTTSGSTGSPKLVRLSHKNLISNADSIAQYLKLSSSDRAITSLPMNYTYGLSIINSHLLSGGSIVVNNKSIMEKDFWESVKQNSVTSLSGVPYTYQMLEKLDFGSMDLPSLRYMTQAGGKLGDKLHTKFARICHKKSIDFYPMYGQTEATARMTYLPPEYARFAIGSIGQPIPNGSIWLTNSGELVYRGDNVSMGYAEGVEDLALGDVNDGILYTGDLAIQDSFGFYKIIGRKKRFLKLFGNRVNLDEIEQAIHSLGYDCAATGVDDYMTVWVVQKVKTDLSAISNLLVKDLGLNPSGHNIRYIESIPRNESGKVIYSNLGGLT